MRGAAQRTFLTILTETSERDGGNKLKLKTDF